MLKTYSSKPDLSAEMEMSACAANWFSNVYPEEDPLAFIWWKYFPGGPKMPPPLVPPFPGIPPLEPWPRPTPGRSKKPGKPEEMVRKSELKRDVEFPGFPLPYHFPEQ
jgi:hypothetical protein